MEFFLVVAALILLLLLFGARKRITLLEERVDHLHQKVDWIYRHGAAKSADGATQSTVSTAPVEPVRPLETEVPAREIDYGPAFKPEPMPEWDDAVAAEAVPPRTPQHDEILASAVEDLPAAPASSYAAEAIQATPARRSAKADDLAEPSEVEPEYEIQELQTPEWLLKAKE